MFFFYMLFVALNLPPAAAKLHIFAPIFDYEMFLLFALSAMLLFSSLIENIKKIPSSLNLLLASSARGASFHR